MQTWTAQIHGAPAPTNQQHCIDVNLDAISYFRLDLHGNGLGYGEHRFSITYVCMHPTAPPSLVPWAGASIITSLPLVDTGK